MNHTASLSDTGTTAGLDFEFSMFLAKHGRVTPHTRGQIEQTPVGPLTHGLREYRCRCCSLDYEGWPRETEPLCTNMKLTQQELIAHLDSELHKRKSDDGRLEKYIDMNDRNVEAQYARTASVATREALRTAMANAPQL